MGATGSWLQTRASEESGSTWSARSRRALGPRQELLLAGPTRGQLGSPGARSGNEPGLVADKRPDLPLPLMREVRQRCGFGCVICGLPLFEYDHLLGWANVQRHVADEIALLCPRHHSEKTRGLLPGNDVREANEHPYNVREGTSKPYDLSYSGDSFEVNIGSVVFRGADRGYGTIVHALRVDGVTLLGLILSEGHYLLNLTLFDAANNLLLRIVDNELVFNLTAWDIELVGRKLVLREGPRRILFDIEFAVPDRVIISRGRFLRNGVEVFVRPEWCALLNSRMFIKDWTIDGCYAGLVLGVDDENAPCVVRLPNIERYSWDRQQSLEWAKNAGATAEELELLGERLWATRPD